MTRIHNKHYALENCYKSSHMTILKMKNKILSFNTHENWCLFANNDVFVCLFYLVMHITAWINVNFSDVVSINPCCM